MVGSGSVFVSCPGVNKKRPKSCHIARVHTRFTANASVEKQQRGCRSAPSLQLLLSCRTANPSFVLSSSGAISCHSFPRPCSSINHQTACMAMVSGGWPGGETGVAGISAAALHAVCCKTDAGFPSIFVDGKSYGLGVQLQITTLVSTSCMVYLMSGNMQQGANNNLAELEALGCKTWN